MAAAFSPAAHAESSIPWTPSPIGRHRLELLVDQAGLALPLTHWPLPRAAVEDALERLPATLPDRLDDARAALRDELARARGASAAVALRSAGERPVGFGDPGAPGASADLRSGSARLGPVAGRLGLHIERATPEAGRPDGVERSGRGGVGGALEGSAIGVEALGLQWQAWAHRSWWGPGWQSSLLLGDNTPAIAAVGLQRSAVGASATPWLAWLGPWSFETFVGRLAGVDRPARPMLFGARLTLRPWSGVEIGLVRSAQWGGAGRSESFRSFVDLLVGRDVNADTPADAHRDPANEMAGYDLRVRCFFGLRCAGYLQLIGEDLGGHWPSRHLGVYGIESWSAEGRHRWFAELAETGCKMPIGQAPMVGCAYRNYAYPGGYTNGRRWLGAGWGPDARVLTLGWIDSAADASWKLHWGRLRTGFGAFDSAIDDPAAAGTLLAASYAQLWRFGAVGVRPEATWLRLRGANGTRAALRAGVAIDVALDGW